MGYRVYMKVKQSFIQVRVTTEQEIKIDNAYKKYIKSLKIDEPSITKPEFIRMTLFTALDI